MKLNQMVTQGVWDSKSAFLMLPHISQEQLRHFSTKKVSFIIFFMIIYDIQEFTHNKK